MIITNKWEYIYKQGRVSNYLTGLSMRIIVFYKIWYQYITSSSESMYIDNFIYDTVANIW